MLRSLKRPFKAVLKSLSLRTVLVLPFVLQTVAITGVVGYLSYVNGQQAVNGLVQQLMGEVCDRIQQHLQSYTELPQQVVENITDDIESGRISLDAEDLQPLDSYFLRRSQTFDAVSFIYVGNEQGKLIGAGPIDKPQNLYVVEVTDRTTNGRYVSYEVDGLGQRVREISAVPNYDPRRRPWYRAALKAGRATWSDIYAYVGEPEQGLTITAVKPFHKATGEVAGVAAVDLYLNDIDQFLKNLQVTKSGQVFILERNGTLVASSHQQAIQVQQNGIGQRVSALTSHDPLIQATIAHVQQTGSLSRIQITQHFEVMLQGQRQFVQVTPWQDSHGLNWLIVAVVPESDFTEQIDLSTRITFLLCGLAVLIALLIGIATARWVTSPIRQLNRAARNLAQGKWDQPIQIDRTDEVGELATTFNQMASQLQQSFEALRQGKAQLSTFLEAVPIGICVVESNGHLSYMNQTAQILLGQTFEPNTLLHIHAALHHAYIAKTEQPYPIEQLPMVLALQGKPAMIEDLEIHQADRVIPLEVRAIPIFKTNQTVRCAIVAIQDIQGRKQAEALLADYNRILEAQIAERTAALTHTNLELEQAKQAAEAANHAKSAFLANMSHELRTPLNAILGFAQVMSMDPQTTVEQQHNLRVINRSGEHLLSLINNVLDLSKIEAGRVEVVRTCFHLAELLETVDSILHRRAEAKGLQFQMVIAPDVPQEIVSDANKLRQTLINLIGNAIKFTEQGDVMLRVSRIGPSRLPHAAQLNRLFEPQEFLLFEVEDSGIGIAPEELSRIFFAFEQSSTGKLTTEGTGLGLTISHKFVELMGGKLSVRSIVGRGSTFTIQLPIVCDRCSLSPVRVHPRSIVGLVPNQPRYRILIVDDQADNRELLGRMLTCLQLDIQTATNGQEAIDFWQQWCPHLILLDLFMPKMDGFTTTQKIRQVEQTQHHCQFKSTKIIALSASVLEADRHRAIEVGCDSFLGKPFQANDLYHVIGQQLDLRFSYTEATAATAPPLEQPLLPQPIDPLRMASVDFMPIEWQAQLYQAALRCRDEQVLEMVAQIPTEHQAIADQLRLYAQKFQFEMILSLLHGYSKEHQA